MRFFICIIFLLVFTSAVFAESPDGFVTYKVKAGDTLSRIAPREHWDIIRRANRIDDAHLIIGKSIFIPNDLEKAKKFMPVPEYVDKAEKSARVIYVFLDKQYFGAYENGKLVFCGPISSGAKGKSTPQGNYKVRWRAKTYHSRKYGADMNFAINISDDGYFLHEQSLPGRPASHGCIRLLRSDAEKIFNWIKKHDPVILAKSTALQFSSAVLFFSKAIF